jgi:3-deoxy-D-manno-octulosonic-acid transferase
LGDSLGEMALYYSLADIALLGGSFAPLGGQNLIEAAACGCGVVMGPHTFNFSEVAQQALASGADGMDFIRSLFLTVARHMSENAVLVLEIGNERENFERAFIHRVPRLEPLWFETSAGPDQVLLLTRQQLI